jgi:Gas vesicle protein
MTHQPPVTQPSLAGLLESPDQSLLDLVDSLLDKGVVLDGELVLGLADVDLVYVRLGVLLAAADRVWGK